MYVECVQCGHGHRWIPAPVEEELRLKNERISVLQNQLRMISVLAKVD